MHIVHLSIGALPSPFTTAGGAVQRRVAELAREHARRGHEVTVIGPGAAPGTRDVDGARLRLLASRAPAPWNQLEFQARALAQLRARRREVDVVHVHNEPEAAIGLRALGIPSVLSYDNFYFRGGRLHGLYRRALASYDALLPVSDYCRDASIDYWRLPPERTHTVPNGVDVEQFAPTAAGGGAARPVVLYLGRVCRQKGSDVLIDAAAALRDELDVVVAGPIGQFTPGGGDADGVDWRRRMEDAGVRYLGRVEETELAALLSSADVFVMPTRELEMQGMAALEALACGTPVIATDHGGLPETVPPECGELVPPGDAAALVASIRRLLADDARRARMAEAGRRHAQTLSWARIADRLEPIYAAVT